MHDVGLFNQRQRVGAGLANREPRPPLGPDLRFASPAPWGASFGRRVTILRMIENSMAKERLPFCEHIYINKVR